MDSNNNGRHAGRPAPAELQAVAGPGPTRARVDAQIAALEAEPDDLELMARAAEAAGAVAFVHFDAPSSSASNIVEALVHHDDLDRIHRGLYATILSRAGRRYLGRVVEGPFYAPDALNRDSTPVRFLILNQNQAQGKILTLPEYHARVTVEVLGEDRPAGLVGATRRPHPASPVLPFDPARMEAMLNLRGSIRLGLLDNYDDVFVPLDETDKNVIPRNFMTVGTVGSGKSNTDQVFIEETLAAGFAQIVVDPEGEYIYMDQPSEAAGIEEDLAVYERRAAGVPHLTVYKPPLSESKRDDAVEFSVPFDSLAPEVIVELTEMSSAQTFRFTFLYDQAIRLLRRQKERAGEEVGNPLTEKDDMDVTRGYPGVTLDLLITMLDEELAYYPWKQENRPAGTKAAPKAKAKKDADEGAEAEPAEAAVEVPEMKIYCHRFGLIPLIQDQHDMTSYGALKKKLRELRMLGIFDKAGVPPLEMERLCTPGHLSVIDMSDSPGQAIVNIVIADLLGRLYHYKMGLSEEQNVQRKVVLTIEEAHGFVSRERADSMVQTLDQLRRVARRGRKRWLCLHFVTQSPQHLPPELFELANNKIIHQTMGADNLRVLKAAAGSVNEGIWGDVPSLGRGRAIIVSNQYPHPLIVRIRPAASRRNYMA